MNTRLPHGQCRGEDSNLCSRGNHFLRVGNPLQRGCVVTRRAAQTALPFRDGLQGMPVMPDRPAVPPSDDPVYELHAAEFAATLTDEQLAAVTDAIRGSSKRGRRRRLLPAEVLALAAIYAERKRRHGVSNGF